MRRTVLSMLARPSRSGLLPFAHSLQPRVHVRPLVWRVRGAAAVESVGPLARVRRFSSAAPKESPPTPTPQAPQQTYLQRYSTVFGKSIATVRHLLNRFQPWSSDHRFAIASWGVVGGVWWILAGTTAFLSLLIWAIPSDKFQEYVAATVSEHVTKYTGAKVTFGSAIQPTWKTLRFSDVRIVRTQEMCGIPNVMEVDITIQQLDVRVSLLWLLEGRGIVEEAELRGVRGTLNRRQSWDKYDELGNLIPWHLQEPVPPEERERAHWYRGSFHLAKCVATDVVLTVYQPQPERPLELVVNSFSSKRLRRQWLMFDLLCSVMDGSADGRLFSLRPPPTMAPDPRYELQQMHMDGINIDVVRAGATGPLTWLTRGNLDLDAIMYLPRVMGAADNKLHENVKMRVTMRLANLNARVPLNSAGISYLNAALVQPIVLYLNTNYVSIPMDAWLTIPMKLFNGAWTPYDAAMTDALSEAVGVELSKRVADQTRPRNLLWLVIRGIEGMWRAARHGFYLATAYATIG